MTVWRTDEGVAADICQLFVVTLDELITGEADDANCSGRRCLADDNVGGQH